MNAYATAMRSPDTNIAVLGNKPVERRMKKEKNQVEGQFTLYNTGAPNTIVCEFFAGESRKVRKGRHIAEGQLSLFDIGVEWTNVIEFPGAAVAEKAPVAAKTPAVETIDDIIRKHTGLVGYCLNQIGGVSSLNRDDVEQAGLLALWKAAEMFDETRGVKFASYATPAIKRAMIRELKGNQDKLNPESWEELESVCPTFENHLATPEEDVFAAIEDSPVISTILDVAKTLRLSKERKGVAAYAMFLQGYSGPQIAKTIGVKGTSYTALISTGRKVIQTNPLFQKAAATFMPDYKKDTVVDLLGSPFNVHYSEDVRYDVPTRCDDDYEGTLARLLSIESVADYVLNEVPLDDDVIICDRSVGCTTIMAVGESDLEISFVVQSGRKGKKSA